MIAMQVHKDAKPNEHGEYDGKDVHGRVLLKRHDSENGHVVFRPESRSYGKFGENAKKAASDFAEKHYPMKDITYMKHESLYDDDKTKFKINPKTSEDELHKIFDNADHALRISMLEQPNAHSSLIHKALDDKSNAPFAKEAAIKNSSVNSEHITKALNLNGSIHRITRAYAAGHPKATSEHITKALNDPSPIVREAAIKNTNGAVKDEHYIKAFDDVNEDVRSSAVGRIKSPKHIDIALNKEQPESVRSQASRNEHANENHIHKALDDDSEWVRLGAIRNKNATRKNIEKALNDPDLSHIARDRMAEFDAQGK
jgi:hypothetical protein